MLLTYAVKLPRNSKIRGCQSLHLLHGQLPTDYLRLCDEERAQGRQTDEEKIKMGARIIFGKEKSSSVAELHGSKVLKTCLLFICFPSVSL